LSNIIGVRAAVLAAVVALAHPVFAGPVSVAIDEQSKPSTNFLPTNNLKPEQVLSTLRRYHDAVVLYRQGHDSEAMAIVNSLPRAQVEYIMDTLRNVRRGRARMGADDAPFDWTRLDCAAAGFLHGDIALSKVNAEDFEDELRLTLTMLPIADLPHVGTDEQPVTWTRDWLRAAANAILASKSWGPLPTLLSYADLFAKDDGPLLLVRGTLGELESEATASPYAWRDAVGPARARADRNALRNEGVEALTRALKVMPDSSEAAVRLAHLRLDMNQPDRAAPLLDRVLRSESGDWWYFAALMRGEADERTGDPPAAEQLYRQLVDRFPRAQSPYLALAMLQYASGRADEAATTFDRLYARASAEGTDDPWWTYATRMGTSAFIAHGQLRHMVRQ
jgi:tetratricopeptide (TPR) repeat protein